MAKDKGKVLSARRASAELGVSVTTAIAMVNRGELAGKQLPDGQWQIPVAEVERLKGELAAARRASGSRFEAAELIAQHAGARAGFAQRHAVQIATQILTVARDIWGRPQAAPQGNAELFETLRHLISDMAQLDVELTGLDHLQDIARDVAMANSARDALVVASERATGMGHDEAERLVAQLDDEQVASRLAELPQVLSGAPSAEGTQ